VLGAVAAINGIHEGPNENQGEHEEGVQKLFNVLEPCSLLNCSHRQHPRISPSTLSRSYDIQVSVAKLNESLKIS
jgi:hypothetical protein